MAHAVQVYLNVVRPLMDAAERFGVEQQFDLSSLNPPEPMYGTSDFWAYLEAGKLLRVVDLKYGFWSVQAAGNKQLRYYGLGALLEAQEQGLDVETVEVTIVQPRLNNPVRTETISVGELLDFADDLMVGAAQTHEPDAPLVAGEHCKFCPAGAVCKTRMEWVQDTAQSQFALVPLERAPSPVAAESLTPEELGSVLQKFDMVADWMKSVRKRAAELVHQGENVPGWKMVERRATRKWADEAEARARLSLDFEFDEHLTEPELKSPAQIEKLLGKKKFAATMADAVVKRSSGYTLAPDYDARPAVSLSAGEEFLLIEAPTGEE
jgi:hypothetical protein